MDTFIHLANSYQAYSLAGTLLGTENTGGIETHSVLEALTPFTHGTRKPRLSQLEQLNSGINLVAHNQGLTLPYLLPPRIHTTELPWVMDGGDAS